DHPAAADMQPSPTAVCQHRLLVTAGFLQRIGYYRQLVKCAILVDAPRQFFGTAIMPRQPSGVEFNELERKRPEEVSKESRRGGLHTTILLLVEGNGTDQAGGFGGRLQVDVLAHGQGGHRSYVCTFFQSPPL